MEKKKKDNLEKIAKNQVKKAIETGKSLGCEFFKVISHNTQSEICKPHESKTYTTNKDIASLGLWEFLSDSNTPPYHPTCSHRLAPVVMTESQIIKIAKRKGISESELIRVLGRA